MVTLADLGFFKNTIYETIICTYNQDASPNAAPMGATMQNSKQITLTVYNSASTLRNLQTRKSATLNLTGDIDVFYRAALKDDYLPAELFEKSGTMDAPKLKLADATIEVAIDRIAPIDELKTQVTCNITQITASKSYPQTYCRAMPAVLEAIIHATRIKVLIGIEKEQAHVAKLINYIQNCNDIVNRSAPNSHYAELMADLQQKIDSWRAQK